MGSPLTEYGRGKYDEDENGTTLTHSVAFMQYPVTRRMWAAQGLAPLSGLFYCGDMDCPATDATFETYLAFANAFSVKEGAAETYVLKGCTGSMSDGTLFCGNIGTEVALSASSPYESNGFRLPTEAEWEYAARAGTRTAYYGGDIVAQSGSSSACVVQPALDPIAWYCSNGADVYHPVGRKTANAWGLYDMLGNAGTYVTDPFVGSGYGSLPRVDPWSLPPAGNGQPVVRGGATTVAGALLRAADRSFAPPKSRGPGFRLVRTLTSGMKLSDLPDLTAFGPSGSDGGVADAGGGG